MAEKQLKKVLHLDKKILNQMIMFRSVQTIKDDQ